MNPSINFSSSNVYVQSSGPCVVCDGPSEHHHSQAEYPTVHPSCLSKVTSSTSGMDRIEDPSSSPASVASSTTSCTSSSITTHLPDGLQLWLCSNCHHLQSPLNFPMNNNSDENSNLHANRNPNQGQNQICYDCSLDTSDYDFRSLMAVGETAMASTRWPTSYDDHDRETITCTSCYQTKDLHEYSSYMTMSMGRDAGYNNMGTPAAICDECVVNISRGTSTQSGQDGQQHHQPFVPGTEYADFGNYSYPSSANTIDDGFLNTHYHDLPQLETLSLGLSNTNDYGYNNNIDITTSTHQPPGSLPTSFNNNAPKNTNTPHPPRTKRKQTRRPKTGTGNNETTDPHAGNEHQEPVIQWISRRDPLPPNVCSRCRCRYARPGKKQCQHCAYDYRGTRDHRASMGLCITCAEPLERDGDLQVLGRGPGQQGVEGSGPGGVGGDNGVMAGGGSESGGTDVGGAGTAGGAKPRRSCKACREKNRLKKAADKAARSRMMAAGGGVDGNIGAVDPAGSANFHGGMIGGGERYVYRTS